MNSLSYTRGHAPTGRTQHHLIKIDAFVGKRKLKSALQNILQEAI